MLGFSIGNKSNFIVFFTLHWKQSLRMKAFRMDFGINAEKKNFKSSQITSNSYPTYALDFRGFPYLHHQTNI